MLDNELKEQLKTVFIGLEAQYSLYVSAPDQHENRDDLIALTKDVADSSEKIDYAVHKGEHLQLKLLKNGQPTGIVFRGVPTGHEFTSLLLAILNSDGKGKNRPDDVMCRRVASLKGEIQLTTYVSLTCTNCPDVVQALNLMALLNPHITHEMVDGALFQEEVEALHIQAVPTVYANGQLLHVGKAGFGELLLALETQFGLEAQAEMVESPEQHYDVVVVGGGPAGSAAAIYSARKGLNVAILAENIGGQVKQTVGIENLISVPYTQGEELAAHLRAHLEVYPVAIFEHRLITKMELRDSERILHTQNGERFVTQSVIIATGAFWRKLNVPGELEYTGHGVAYCPHCDGPFYKNKPVAVVGGGNSGIEAAIDLAGICSKVTVLEFLDTLKADEVLQKKLKTLSNVEIFTASQTIAIEGDGNKVTGIRIKERHAAVERTIPLSGVFVQIGLSSNSAPFQGIVNTNAIGEIEIDAHCRTSQKGIYAAGDVSTVPYKQIIISMGEGAKAALSAYEDRIRK
ncbi:MAG: alkyl hydroperoxide reductase subunit F [Bacteroidales bacterium]|nr:alkyl hydroperoxide reductase subunit F [Bacteroidales bacterium]